MVSLCWFRDDLRLNNNASLNLALESNQCFLVYIYDMSSKNEIGGAQKVWLEKSLESFANDIRLKGGVLNIFKGDPVKIIPELVEKYNINSVCWNRRYYPDGVNKDKEIKANLKHQGIQVNTFRSTMLNKEPWEILNQQGKPYKVFTPYYKAVRSYIDSTERHAPKDFNHTNTLISELKIKNLGLSPDSLSWPNNMLKPWKVDEQGALTQLEEFIEIGLCDYPESRDFMVEDGTSKLSLYLPIGNISTQIISKYVLDLEPNQAREVFIRQLIWREFSQYLLWHFPKLGAENFNAKFNNFHWENSLEHLKKWQLGETGYPIVDAGMRELWQTGYMHNRVRMIVASFLTKHLLIDWRLGEKWFWDTLIDADVAVNPISWQWASGCGVDAAPYFRIFNPWLQSKKFDEKAEYIKKWVPELSQQPPQNIHNPNKIKGYFEPIIEHSYARQRALDEYQKIKSLEER